jgi:hypothetical protein
VKSCLYIILILSLPGLGLAQTVTGYIGDLAHDGTLTISGFDFGNKATANPLVWDNMESGQFSSQWSGTDPTGDLSILQNSNARHGNSGFCGTLNMRPVAGQTKAYFQQNTLSEYFYGQFWFKLGANFEWGTGFSGQPDAHLASAKILRLWNYNDGVDYTEVEDVIISNQGYNGGALILTVERVDYGHPEGYDRTSYFSNTNIWEKDVWHCFQFQYKESDLGVSNGTLKIWSDGQLIFGDENVMTRDDRDVFKQVARMGLKSSWGDSSTDDNDYYIDDAYLDTTWSRVEIGNNVDYEACTHREIQIPTDWDPESISVTVNTGSFDLTEDLFIFVTDAQGNVGSGFPLGEVEMPGLPGIPTRTVQ